MNKIEGFNMEADGNDDFRTPLFLFKWIEHRFGQIDFDAACIDGVNNLTAALRLEDEWPPESRVFSNPPWDSESIEKWLAKGMQHASNGGTHIMLIPMKLCQVFFSPWFGDIDHMVFLGGRVDYEGPHSCKGGTSRNGSVIVVQGWDEDVDFEGVRLRDIKKWFEHQEIDPIYEIERRGWKI